MIAGGVDVGVVVVVVVLCASCGVAYTSSQGTSGCEWYVIVCFIVRTVICPHLSCGSIRRRVVY